MGVNSPLTLMLKSMRVRQVRCSGVGLGLSPPAYIFEISRLYFTCIPPMYYRILGIPFISVVSIYI